MDERRDRPTGQRSKVRSRDSATKMLHPLFSVAEEVVVARAEKKNREEKSVSLPFLSVEEELRDLGSLTSGTAPCQFLLGSTVGAVTGFKEAESRSVKDG